MPRKEIPRRFLDDTRIITTDTSGIMDITQELSIEESPMRAHNARYGDNTSDHKRRSSDKISSKVMRTQTFLRVLLLLGMAGIMLILKFHDDNTKALEKQIYEMKYILLLNEKQREIVGAKIVMPVFIRDALAN